MALSNPYSGKRLPGYVGQPLPGMAVKLLRDDGSEIPESSSESGELLVAGQKKCDVVVCWAVTTAPHRRAVHVFALH